VAAHIEFDTKAVYGMGFEPDLRTLKRFPFKDIQHGQNFLMDDQTEARWSLGDDVALSGLVLSDGKSGEVGVKYEPPGWNFFVTAALYEITQSNVLTPDP